MNETEPNPAFGTTGTRRERLGRGAGVVGRVGVEVSRLAYDRAVRRPRIPSSVAGVDAAVLTRLLGLPVTDIHLLGATEGTTGRARIALTGDGAPASVFVKMAAGSAGIRLFGNLANLGANEVAFYRDVRPHLDIETPVVHGLDYEPRTKRFVLVLEDLEARGCTFTELVDAVDVDQARAALDTLARLHGSTSAGGPIQGPQWLRSNSADPLLPLYDAVLGRMVPRLARVETTLFSPGGRTILANYPAVARLLDEGPQALLHGDPHPGNWYYDGDRAGLLDWQAIRRGNPLRDVAYFVILGLDPSTRRAHERDLLHHYTERLAEHGGHQFDEPSAWATYRRMSAYPYVAATLTSGFGGLQSDETAFEGLRRAAAAVEDLKPDEVLLPSGR